MNIPLLYELDAVLKISAVGPVVDAFVEGRHDDLEAIESCGRILRRTAHRLKVCRGNLPREA